MGLTLVFDPIRHSLFIFSEFLRKLQANELGFLSKEPSDIVFVSSFNLRTKPLL